MHTNTSAVAHDAPEPTKACPVYKRLFKAYGPVMAAENVARALCLTPSYLYQLLGEEKTDPVGAMLEESRVPAMRLPLFQTERVAAWLSTRGPEMAAGLRGA